jgi:hypothetical protein
MGVIRQERPGKASCLALEKQISKAIQEVLPIIIVAEYLSAFNPSDDDVMKGTRSVYSGFSRHD